MVSLVVKLIEDEKQNVDYIGGEMKHWCMKIGAEKLWYYSPCVEHGLVPLAINDLEQSFGTSSRHISAIKLALRWYCGCCGCWRRYSIVDIKPEE